MKRDIQDEIGYEINRQLRGVQIAKPVTLHYMWVEPNRKRDKDNIVSAQKFVQDALVKMRVIKNDGWKQIEGFTHWFAVDKENPRVEITIEETLALTSKEEKK
jgi:Holliday junction resolvase RusA-like endonuclease